MQGLKQTCQLTPIKSVTHAFDITHTLTRIHNSFTRIPPNLAARLKKSIVYTNLLTGASPCNRSTPCDITGDVYMRTCGQMTDMTWPVQVLLCTAKYSTEHMLHVLNVCGS